jgi:multisubunit Na+/H+ antiporter MnhF subunit
MMTEMLIFAAAYGFLAVLNLYRLLKGPTAADRMVAADAADILVCCAMVLFALYSGRGIYLDIAIISAVLGIVDTMLVGRFLSRKRREQDGSAHRD